MSALSLAPVKGLRLGRAERVVLDEHGVCGDRRMFVVDARGRMLNAKRHGALQQVVARLEGERLTLEIPGGAPLSEELRLHGEPFVVSFFSDAREARLVAGTFSEALSEHVGEPLRLVAFADGARAVDRGRQGGVTLVSRSSVAALAELAGGELDPRRFRMSIELEGADAFAEDAWLGCDVAIGSEVVIRPKGHVGRCLVTSRHPETGEMDVPTLDLLRALRGEQATTEPLALGVYGAVVHPGEVAVGDELRVLARA